MVEFLWELGTWMSAAVMVGAILVWVLGEVLERRSCGKSPARRTRLGG